MAEVIFNDFQMFQPDVFFSVGGRGWEKWAPYQQQERNGNAGMVGNAELGKRESKVSHVDAETKTTAVDRPTGREMLEDTGDFSIFPGFESQALGIRKSFAEALFEKDDCPTFFNAILIFTRRHVDLHVEFFVATKS